MAYFLYNLYSELTKMMDFFIVLDLALYRQVKVIRVFRPYTLPILWNYLKQLKFCLRYQIHNLANLDQISVEIYSRKYYHLC